MKRGGGKQGRAEGEADLAESWGVGVTHQSFPVID